ncbi:MAG TPA: hypothetical protein VIJ20_02665, partial [Solirubrobacteraceae bacterium]
MSGGTDILIATGDPGPIEDAGARCARMADGFDVHAGTIQCTAASLYGAWNGVAAYQYQDLSNLITAHFRAAATTSRAAAAALKSYGAKLRQCREEGLVALSQAEQCLVEIAAQTNRLNAAEEAVRTAESNLSSARSSGRLARGLGNAVAAQDADAAASYWQGQLDSARAEAQAAKGALDSLRAQLKQYRARGHAAWRDAQTAADQATGSLAALTITAPPIPGMANLPVGGRPVPVSSPGRDRSATGRGSATSGTRTPPARERMAGGPARTSPRGSLSGFGSPPLVDRLGPMHSGAAAPGGYVDRLGPMHSGAAAPGGYVDRLGSVGSGAAAAGGYVDRLGPMHSGAAAPG